MTSIWMRSASAPRTFTSSARRARSAERIDAASMTLAILVGGGCSPAKGGDEHRVAPMTVRPQANPFGSAVGPRDLHRLERPRAAKDRIARRVGLGAGDGANRGADPPARARGPPRRAPPPPPRTRKPRSPSPPPPPQQLRTPPGRPDPRTRRVDQDAVEPPAQRRPPGVLHVGERSDAEPSGVRADEL